MQTFGKNSRRAHARAYKYIKAKISFIFLITYKIG